MAAEVVVMYSNLTISRVIFSSRASLRRDDVLAIAISHPEQPTGTLRRKRQQAVQGHDFYVLAFDSVRNKCFLGGYDASDFGWFNLVDPWLPSERWLLTETSQPSWFPSSAMIFKGSQVSGAVWQQAQAKFLDPEGGMY